MDFPVMLFHGVVSARRKRMLESCDSAISTGDTEGRATGPKCRWRRMPGVWMVGVNAPVRMAVIKSKLPAGRIFAIILSDYSAPMVGPCGGLLMESCSRLWCAAIFV